MEVVVFAPRHIGAAAEIEKLCFSEPWSASGLQMLCEPGNIAFAAVINGELVAYAGMVTVLDEGQIVNVAVHPGSRRRGYGRAVLGALIDYADKNGIANLYLEVRESNAPAITLYRNAGFAVAGQRPRYYRHPTETALIMVRSRAEQL